MTEPTEPTLHTAHTCLLTPAALDEIRTFLDTAFEGDFSDDDWDHGLGGIHAYVRDGSGLLAHGSVVQRRVIHEGRSYRIGYVEAVAVRADRRREGLGGRVMAMLEQVVDGAYAFGALSASAAGAALYAGRGWLVWPGRIAVLGRYGVERLPDEEGSIRIRGVAGPVLPPASGTLIFDWRDGDVL
ncbi:GNAT family N-acetyltransferase [Streptomyces atratus]|uniref:GNAT family N-acetyltransferase n=1 Tax=Streptomyces atratus TaxID=1893 RepID=UPI0016716546|nr:GNAT family N-acetyltransferase [Streptomyces atratus]WPW31601.1 GNAT family N-acetyltransferase [Streptomyces atratus]GGT40252.1 aminoglycoside 2'-N-acetyltransferase [Streptomyces atratus]